MKLAHVDRIEHDWFMTYSFYNNYSIVPYCKVVHNTAFYCIKSLLPVMPPREGYKPVFRLHPVWTGSLSIQAALSI